MKQSFEMSPLIDYNQPKYPTYENMKNDPALLKKLPARWKKSLGALACAGLLGTAAMLGLGGCASALRGCTGGCSDLQCHFGGAGGPPLYIVYLTEQEAIEVIRNKAEYMGLSMNDSPPDYTVRVGWSNDREVSFGLFNENKNIAFSHIGPRHRYDLYDNFEILAREAQEAFDEKDNDLIVKVFHNNTDESYTWSLSDEIRADMRENLKRHLTAQVKEFIEWLQAEGIVQ